MEVEMASSEITVTITLEELAKRIEGAFLARVEFEHWTNRIVAWPLDDEPDKVQDGEYLMIRLPAAEPSHD
jgi:hypothetical protein